jgi:hypothetical protein
MIKWRESSVYPFLHNLPKQISFPYDFWSDVKKIHELTKKDGLERAISLFWADGELIVTSVVTGDEGSVKSNHSVNVKYIHHPTRKDYLRKEVWVDGKVLKRKDVYYKKAPKKVSVEYLFNMHTHPPHVGDDGNSRYSFFSAQDIRSLLSSNAVVTGLVSDKVWLLVRSSESPSSVDITDRDITIEYLKENLKFGVYVAEFNKKAIRR